MLQCLTNSFLDFLSFIQMVNLVPNYKIISNPTTFSCKTLPPRMIIFNSLLFEPAGEGKWRKRRRQRGNGLGRGREGESLLIVHLPSGTGTSSWTSIFSVCPALTFPDGTFVLYSILEAICFCSRWHQPSGSLLDVHVTPQFLKSQVYLGLFRYKPPCSLHKKR